MNTLDNVMENKRAERMKFIRGKRPGLFYPNDSVANSWDLIMTLVIIFTSFVTPVRIAFYEEDNLAWRIVNTLIDTIFILDILYSFNISFLDEHF